MKPLFRPSHEENAESMGEAVRRGCRGQENGRILDKASSEDRFKRRAGEKLRTGWAGGVFTQPA